MRKKKITIDKNQSSFFSQRHFCPYLLTFTPIQVILSHSLCVLLTAGSTTQITLNIILHLAVRVYRTLLTTRRYFPTHRLQEMDKTCVSLLTRTTAASVK